ncbi:MAG: BolA family transcriptional regulator [Alphaproteobacteria bacterium]|nr:BolA family transcriptional regulator [Alphaproteobacteria bacterium]
MRVQQALRDKLMGALAPSRLDIVDESRMHAGHAGARPEGESHFRLTIVSEKFRGLTRLARQRLVYAAVSEEMRRDVHALALTTLTPEEDAG